MLLELCYPCRNCCGGGECVLGPLPGLGAPTTGSIVAMGCPCGTAGLAGGCLRPGCSQAAAVARCPRQLGHGMARRAAALGGEAGWWRCASVRAVLLFANPFKPRSASAAKSARSTACGREGWGRWKEPESLPGFHPAERARVSRECWGCCLPWNYGQPLQSVLVKASLCNSQ